MNSDCNFHCNHQYIILGWISKSLNHCIHELCITALPTHESVILHCRYQCLLESQISQFMNDESRNEWILQGLFVTWSKKIWISFFSLLSSFITRVSHALKMSESFSNTSIVLLSLWSALKAFIVTMKIIPDQLHYIIFVIEYIFALVKVQFIFTNLPDHFVYRNTFHFSNTQKMNYALTTSLMISFHMCQCYSFIYWHYSSLSQTYHVINYAHLYTKSTFSLFIPQLSPWSNDSSYTPT